MSNPKKHFNMKKLFYISILIIIGGIPSVLAQKIGNLNGIYYQAVAVDEVGKEIVGTDINNKPLYKKVIGVRFTITKGLNGAIQWEETHTTNTDRYGLFSLIIGQGKSTGNGKIVKMLDIPWIDADQFLKVEIATKNDGNYKLVSNQQFMSVPYSFYTDDIADDAITTFKILDSAILNRDISTGAVDSRTILNETILSEDIDTGAVTTSEILDSTIIARDLQTGAVDSRVILDSAIIDRDIKTGAVDSRIILDSAIINRDLQTNTVDSRTILNNSIINEDIQTGAVNSRSILNGSILNEDILDSTINLASKVTGILSIAHGGTGTDTVTTNSLLVGNARGKGLLSLGQATDGQIPIGVTGEAPKLKILSGQNGVNVAITADSVIISSGIQGVFSTLADSISPSLVAFRSSWLSPPIALPGVVMGSIVHGSIDTDLNGCVMSTYVSAPNTIRVSIYNGTDRFIDLGVDRPLRVLVVK